MDNGVEKQAVINRQKDHKKPINRVINRLSTSKLQCYGNIYNTDKPHSSANRKHEPARLRPGHNTINVAAPGMASMAGGGPCLALTRRLAPGAIECQGRGRWLPLGELARAGRITGPLRAWQCLIIT